MRVGVGVHGVKGGENVRELNSVKMRGEKGGPGRKALERGESERKSGLRLGKKKK